MKRLSVLLLILFCSGCSTLDPALRETLFPNPNTYGYRPGDPCIKCGESFIFLRNEEMGAQKQREAEWKAQNQERKPKSD